MSNRLKIIVILLINILAALALCELPQKLFSQDLGPIVFAAVFASGLIQGGLLKFEQLWATLVGTQLGLLISAFMHSNSLIGFSGLIAIYGTFLIQAPALCFFPAIRHLTRKSKN